MQAICRQLAGIAHVDSIGWPSSCRWSDRQLHCRACLHTILRCCCSAALSLVAAARHLATRCSIWRPACLLRGARMSSAVHARIELHLWREFALKRAIGC